MNTGFAVPAAPCVVEEIVKRSRFITVIERVEHGAQARALQARLKAEHPEATHHCLAFVAGAPGCTRDIGAADDGEPSGSAGRPMLNVLLGSEVGQLAAVSIRYYGGTKLGVGGLVRAYAGGVKLALEHLQVEPFVPMREFTLAVDYADISLLEHLLSLHQGQIVQQQYGLNVQYDFALPQAEIDAFAEQFSQRSGGRLHLPKPSKG